jgi:hypothetical protein
MSSREFSQSRTWPLSTTPLGDTRRVIFLVFLAPLPNETCLSADYSISWKVGGVLSDLATERGSV